QHRGGLGAELVVTALASFSVSAYTERRHCPPWGLAEGQAGAGNRVDLRIGGEWREGSNAKVLSQRLVAGDALRIRSGGGGGFGDPRQRETERVARDVSEGYVTRGAAEREYGVCIDSEGNVDMEQTVRRRSVPLA